MKFQYSDYIPFIGYKKGLSFVTKLFPPKTDHKAVNEIVLSTDKRSAAESYGNSCTCPDGQIYITTDPGLNT